MKLRIAEEILLLLLDEQSGDLADVSEDRLHLALAGAVLVDLAFEDRIDTDLEKLVLESPEPLGDELLDPFLARIAESGAKGETRDAEHWLRILAKDGEAIRETALARLVDAGVLESAEEGLIALSRRVRRARRYPVAGDGQVQQDVRLRVMQVLFGDDVPAPRDAAIIGLADACGFFDGILAKDELADVADRLDWVRRLDLIGRTVARIVGQLVEEASRAPAAPASAPIPFAKGLPILGCALEARKNLTDFLVEKHLELGPLFKVRFLGHEVYILAGQEADTWVHKQGKRYLRSLEPWSGFYQELGLSKVLTAMDGTEHVRFRRFNATLYARGRFENHMDAAVDIVRDEIDSWGGRSLGGVHAMQRIISRQLGTILTHSSPAAYMDDFLFFFDTLLATRIARQRPMFIYARKFKKVRRRIESAVAEVIEEHRPGGRWADAGDMVNELLELHESEPVFFPETDLKFGVMTPYLVGLDTVGVSCAYMLYALFKHPEVLERARAEADAWFAEGPPTAAGLRRLETIHRVALETLRRYPIVPVVPRHVSNSFEYAGHRVPAGVVLLVAATVSHFVPELFPEPYTFDIDRYLPGRAEHRQRNAFVPFGLGSHRCLGAGFAEAQIVLNFATILHEAEIAMDPPGYELTTSTIPTIRPDKRFRFRLVRRRGRPTSPGGRS